MTENSNLQTAGYDSSQTSDDTTAQCTGTVVDVQQGGYWWQKTQVIPCSHTHTPQLENQNLSQIEYQPIEQQEEPIFDEQIPPILDEQPNLDEEPIPDQPNLDEQSNPEDEPIPDEQPNLDEIMTPQNESIDDQIIGIQPQRYIAYDICMLTDGTKPFTNRGDIGEQTRPKSRLSEEGMPSVEEQNEPLFENFEQQEEMAEPIEESEPLFDQPIKQEKQESELHFEENADQSQQSFDEPYETQAPDRTQSMESQIPNDWIMYETSPDEQYQHEEEEESGIEIGKQIAFRPKGFSGSGESGEGYDEEIVEELIEYDTVPQSAKQTPISWKANRSDSSKYQPIDYDSNWNRNERRESLPRLKSSDQINMTSSAYSKYNYETADKPIIEDTSGFNKYQVGKSAWLFPKDWDQFVKEHGSRTKIKEEPIDESNIKPRSGSLDENVDAWGYKKESSDDGWQKRERTDSGFGDEEIGDLSKVKDQKFEDNFDESYFLRHKSEGHFDESSNRQKIVSDKNEWFIEKDEIGTWVLPTTIFGHPFPRGQVEDSGTGTVTDAATQTEFHHLRDSETQTEEWEKRDRKDSGLGDEEDEIKDRKLEDNRFIVRTENEMFIEKDEIGTWVLPTTIFGHPFPRGQVEDTGAGTVTDAATQTEFHHLRDTETQTEEWEKRDRKDSGLGDEGLGDEEENVDETQQKRIDVSTQTGTRPELRSMSTELSSSHDSDNIIDETYFDETGHESAVRELFAHADSKTSDKRSHDEEFSTTLQHAIYSKTDSEKKPIGVLNGRIHSQNLANSKLNYRNGSSRIRTILMDKTSESAANVVSSIESSPNLVTITTTDNGIACIQGETGGGFTISGGSVLKLSGQLITRTISGEETVHQLGSCNVVITKDVVFVIICDDHIILLDSGENQFKVIKRELSTHS